MGAVMRFKRIRVISVLSLAILAGAAVMLSGQGTNAEAATLPQEQAVGLAAQYARTRMVIGHLVSGPTQVNAQTMTLDAAVQLEKQPPLDPATQQGQQRTQLVWLVFLRGDIAVPDEVEPGMSPRPALTYHQMSVVLDAVTGEKLQGAVYAPEGEVVAAGGLPAVALPPAGVTFVPPPHTQRVVTPLPSHHPPGPTSAPFVPKNSGATPAPVR